MPTPHDEPEIRNVSTRVVYQNRWMTVREDQIVRVNGQPGIYGVVEKNDFAVIVPFLGDQLILVEQYRYPVQGRFWEFPQGSWERTSIAPEALARAELEEETGYAAGQVTHLGHLFAAYGYSNQGYDIFVAKDLSPTAKNLDPEEAGLISKPFSIDEVRAMILDGRIKDATTVAVFGLLQFRGLI
jgi:ADP-ribose pyrophosphatase